MRTFVLLTAILLVTFQAKAEPVPPTDHDTLGQEPSEAEDQLMAISASMDEESALQDPGSTGGIHRCRCTRWFCWPWERNTGPCGSGPYEDKFCCRV